MKIVINWIIATLAILISSYILPGIHLNDFLTAIFLAIVLGVINAFLKPIIILLTLPINIITLGLFTLVINAFLILIASRVVPGFIVDSFGWALLFSIILSLFTSLLRKLT